MVNELVSNFPKLKFENDFYKILNEIKEFCEKIGDIENKFAAIMLELDWPLHRFTFGYGYKHYKKNMIVSLIKARLVQK